MATSRATFQGTARELADAFKHDAMEADFLPEPKKLERRKEKQKRMRRSGPLLVRLRALQENLSFPKTKIIQALKLVVSENELVVVDTWFADKQKLLKEMCRYVGQALAHDKTQCGCARSLMLCPRQVRRRRRQR